MEVVEVLVMEKECTEREREREGQRGRGKERKKERPEGARREPQRTQAMCQNESRHTVFRYKLE